MANTNIEEIVAVLDTARPRKGDWGQSYSGKKFWPLDPRPEDFNITDIAHSLSLICRFGGHSKFHYSVAQHSVLVAQLAPEELQLQALMHDASESYICDIPRTFKSQLVGYKELEDDVMKAIAERYGFSYPLDPLIKDIDNRMLMTERYQVMNPGPYWSMEDNVKPYRNVVIEQMQPIEAEKLFIESYLGISARQTNQAFSQSLNQVLSK
jgi:uncharacterized protein